MTVTYNGKHSITFYDDSQDPVVSKNSWTDFKLIPASAPFVAPPTPEMTIVSVPGTNHVIDLTGTPTGKIIQGRRTGDWEFYMVGETLGSSKTWLNGLSKITNFIDGRWLRVGFSEDTTDKYYSGRINVSDFTVEENYAKVKLSYNLGTINRAIIDDGGSLVGEDVVITGENDGLDIDYETPEEIEFDMVDIAINRGAVITVVVTGSDVEILLDESDFTEEDLADIEEFEPDDEDWPLIEDDDLIYFDTEDGEG